MRRQLSKADIVQGLLEGHRVGAYTYFVGLRVRSHTDRSLWGDHVDAGTICGFVTRFALMAVVELDIKSSLMLGHTRGRYVTVPLIRLIPID